MTISVLDTFPAATVEPDDYIRLLGDDMLVSDVIDNGGTVTIVGYSDTEGDTVSHTVPADYQVSLLGTMSEEI